MIHTVSLTTEIPANHEIKLLLPPDVPAGPAELLLVVVPHNHQEEHTLGELLDSEFFGMWRDRIDIEDSVDFARQLRQEAWKRPV